MTNCHRMMDSWLEFISIVTCGEFGPCPLSCCDMFNVQNLHFTHTLLLLLLLLLFLLLLLLVPLLLLHTTWLFQWNPSPFLILLSSVDKDDPQRAKKDICQIQKIGWFILSFGGIWIFAIYNFCQSIDCNVTPLHMLLILGEMKLLIFSLRLNSAWNQLHFLYWRLPLLTC